jgi:hypothetical protein
VTALLAMDRLRRRQAAGAAAVSSEHNEDRDRCKWQLIMASGELRVLAGPGAGQVPNLRMLPAATDTAA